MRLRLSDGSLLLFGLAIILWMMLTLLESAVVGMSLTDEKVLTFLLLVLPSGVGAVLGMISLLRKDGPVWVAVAGALLNCLFTFFHLMILAFAG